MDALDYILLIGSFLILIFTLVCDVLLIREWMRKRAQKQGHQEKPDHK